MSSLQGYIDRIPPLFIHCSTQLTPRIGRVLLVLQDGRAIVVAYTFTHFLPNFPPPPLLLFSFSWLTQPFFGTGRAGRLRPKIQRCPL